MLILEDIVLLVSIQPKEVSVSKMIYIANFKTKIIHFCSDVNKYKNSLTRKRGSSSGEFGIDQCKIIKHYLPSSYAEPNVYVIHTYWTPIILVYFLTF